MGTFPWRRLRRQIPASPAPRKTRSPRASVERAKRRRCIRQLCQAEIAPCDRERPAAGETRGVDIDEGPGKVKRDKVTGLKPAFTKTARSPPLLVHLINDGAAASVLMRESTAAEARLQAVGARGEPRHATPKRLSGVRPPAPWVPHQTALVRSRLASQRCSSCGKSNEAFAVVPMALMHELYVRRMTRAGERERRRVCLGAPHRRVGCAHHGDLSRMLCKRVDSKKGLATLCIGGGEGAAMALELV